MNAVDIECRSALIRVFGVGLVAENPVLDSEKAEIHIGAGISSRSYIDAIPESPR